MWNGGLFEQRVGLAVGRLPGGFQEVCGVRRADEVCSPEHVRSARRGVRHGGGAQLTESPEEPGGSKEISIGGLLCKILSFVPAAAEKG